ncbi:MAG TPA: purine-nucleoside phosphorylase, partial [bacterium]|nr:purine-nucleoside phosphorylase [bacterium]
MNKVLKKLKETVEYVKPFIKEQPEIGLILGSGLGGLGDEIENPAVLKYSDIPNFPLSKIAGHKGQLVIG